MNQPIDNGNQPYHTPWGTPVGVRRFADDSEIIYYDSGKMVYITKPPRADEPPRVPMARLYYWQVERNRPDIETWEQIRQAENNGEE